MKKFSSNSAQSQTYRYKGRKWVQQSKLQRRSDNRHQAWLQVATVEIDTRQSLQILKHQKRPTVTTAAANATTTTTFVSLTCGGICVPPKHHLLAIPRFQLNTYGHQVFSVAGRMVWNSLPNFIWDPTSSIDCFTLLLTMYCSRDTTTSSALGVLNDYVLHKSTHSHSLTRTCTDMLPSELGSCQWPLFHLSYKGTSETNQNFYEPQSNHRCQSTEWNIQH